MPMRQLNNIQNFLFRLGAVLMLIGAAVRLFSQQMSLWLFCIGCLLFSLMQIKAEYLGRDTTLVRLRRQQLLGICCFILCAVCMSMQTFHYGLAQSNEWVLALLIGCVFQLYTAWRIPQELDRQKK